MGQVGSMGKGSWRSASMSNLALALEGNQRAYEDENWVVCPDFLEGCIRPPWDTLPTHLPAYESGREHEKALEVT